MIVIATIAKIKILYIVELRRKLEQIYEEKSQIDLAKWTLQLAKYVFLLIEYDYENVSVIVDGLTTNEKWQIGEERILLD